MFTLTSFHIVSFSWLLPHFYLPPCNHPFLDSSRTHSFPFPICPNYHSIPHFPLNSVSNSSFPQFSILSGDFNCFMRVALVRQDVKFIGKYCTHIHPTRLFVSPYLLECTASSGPIILFSVHAMEIACLPLI